MFWFEVACAAFALTILVLFVKIKKAESELTVYERAELESSNGAAVEREDKVAGRPSMNPGSGDAH